jgi:hypothetical protein
MGTQLFRENAPHASKIDFFGKVVVHRFSFFGFFQVPPILANPQFPGFGIPGDLRILIEILYGGYL